MAGPLPHVVRISHKCIWRLTIAACMPALFLTACKQETSPIATAPPLTPTAAVSTPTESGSAQTQAALPATKLPAQADAAPTPPAASLSAAPSPTVPAEVVARTSERVDELTARLLRPRRINVDVLWGGFVTSRAFGIGTDWVPDLDAPAKMLEMWHPGNACYAIVESEVDQLESDNRLRPVEFTLYFDYISAQLSPCLDEQLPQVDAEQFFSIPTLTGPIGSPPDSTVFGSCPTPKR